MKYTPGPWKVGKSYTSEPCIREPNGDAVAVACDLFEGEADANARLIAAAPDMYEALQGLAKEINLSKLNIKKDFSLINAHAYALKALAKAEGR